MPGPSNLGYFRIALRSEEADYPALIDVASFVYDFNLLYEFSRIIADPKYSDYRFSRYSAYRNARRLRTDDRLEIERLYLASPFELITVVAAAPATAAALWVFVQTLEKVVNFPINRDILKLQREKLRRELESPDADVPSQMPDSDTAFGEAIRVREAEEHFDRVVRHLQEGHVHVREIDVTHVPELPVKRDSGET